MSFGLSPLSQLVSRFVPKFLTRTVSHSFNRMVSKALPQKEDDLLGLDQSTDLSGAYVDDA